MSKVRSDTQELRKFGALGGESEWLSGKESRRRLPGLKERQGKSPVHPSFVGRDCPWGAGRRGSVDDSGTLTAMT
jgi:hypothetical protein